jgi:UDP-N-acetylmuramyl pentapeptide phosphotransferase/UDP-N-acetylglucosamine-1-phosphate transferase
MSFLPWGMLAVLAAVLALSWAANRPALKLAAAYGLIDRPGQHKRHHREVPVTGGIILFPCLWAVVGAAVLLAPGSFRVARPVSLRLQGGDHRVSGRPIR